MKIPLFFKPSPQASPQAIDPVCSMSVSIDKPPGGWYEHEDRTYYFCAPGCNRVFQKEPEEYLSGRKKINM